MNNDAGNPFPVLKKQNYMSLTTYRKNGRGVLIKNVRI